MIIKLNKDENKELATVNDPKMILRSDLLIDRFYNPPLRNVKKMAAGFPQPFPSNMLSVRPPPSLISEAGRASYFCTPNL